MLYAYVQLFMIQFLFATTRYWGIKAVIGNKLIALILSNLAIYGLVVLGTYLNYTAYATANYTLIFIGGLGTVTGSTMSYYIGNHKKQLEMI